MRLRFLALALAAACGGSPDPAPPARPADTALPSVPITSNTPPAARPRPAPPREPRPEPAPAPPPSPPPPADGIYSPQTVRANSTRLLDQRITVKGTVVWIYDCVADIAAREPDRSRDEIRTRVAKRPDLCKRPHFYLGDRRSTPLDRAIQVVEVPRPLRPDERISMSEKEIAAWPPVPSLAVGQVVAVEGTWALHSPRGYANPAGLLVYGRLAP